MKEESINKRKIQAANTKKRIFDMASQLVSKHGVEHISVDSIVKAAGISKGTFYVHYKSKDELIVDLVNYYTHTADMDYKSISLSLKDTKSSLDFLLILAEEIADYIENRIGFENMKALYTSHLAKTIDTASALNYSRYIYQIFNETIEKGIKTGELRSDIPVETLANHLIIAARGVVFEWCIRHPNLDLRESLLTHFKILVKGLCDKQ